MKRRSNLGKKLWKEETWIILYFDGDKSKRVEARRPEIRWSVKNGHAAFLIVQSIPKPLSKYAEPIETTLSLESFGRFLHYLGYPIKNKIETKIIYE